MDAALKAMEIRTTKEYAEIRRTKAYLDVDDIMMRYGVGKASAYGIIQGIKQVCDGGQLPVGKVLPAEVEYWEEFRYRVEMKEPEPKRRW